MISLESTDQQISFKTQTQSPSLPKQHKKKIVETVRFSGAPPPPMEKPHLF